MNYAAVYFCTSEQLVEQLQSRLDEPFQPTGLAGSNKSRKKNREITAKKDVKNALFIAIFAFLMHDVVFVRYYRFWNCVYIQNLFT